jgi:hypothetical protein
MGDIEGKFEIESAKLLINFFFISKSLVVNPPPEVCFEIPKKLCFEEESSKFFLFKTEFLNP